MHDESFDATAEVGKIKDELRDEQERAERRAIIERQHRTLPPPNRIGLIDIGPRGALARAQGVIVRAGPFPLTLAECEPIFDGWPHGEVGR